MTIVKRPEWLLHQPLLKLDEGLLTDLKNSRNGESLRPIVSLFEAYLQVANLPTVTSELLQGDDCAALIEGFIGALHSARFMTAPLRSTYLRSTDFLQFIAPAGKTVHASLSTTKISPEVASWVSRFELLQLNEEQAWVKSGWGCVSKAGATICFPLYPIYQSLGRPFTQQFANALETWAKGRRSAQIRVLGYFCRFFSDHPDGITREILSDPYAIGQALRKFGRYYFRESKGRGGNVKTSIRAWNSTFIPLINSLISAHVIAKPEPPLIPIRAVRVTKKPSETNLRKTTDGLEIKVNLLTDIPLSVTDFEAKELLFKQIQEDFAASVTWAELEADDLWRRHTEARAAAPEGQTRVLGEALVKVGSTWLLNTQNPDCLANCAATYSAHGHPGSSNAWFYRELGYVSAAHLLGLPINGALLPHASILVANFPEITSAFLDSLELYNKDGILCGIVTTDAGKYLVGCKRRKGAKLAEQRILLEARTTQIVEQVIELTKPLREYLREQGNDAWRYLFLTAHGVGATPKTQRFSDQCSAPHKWGEHGLVASYAERLEIETNVAADLVAHFSLKNLRGSAAIIIYLQTGDAQKMSEALGHTTHQPRLLDFYLPAPIQQFFNARWIRIFQAGIICQSLQDSPFLLEASGFKTMGELDQFLEKHAIKEIPEHLTDPRRSSPNLQISGSLDQSEVVFSVSAGVLTILLSVQSAVDAALTPSSGPACFWAEISRRLVVYIEALTDRPDLSACLTEARRHARADLVKAFVHE